MNFTLFSQTANTVTNFIQPGSVAAILSIEIVIITVAIPILFNSLIRAVDKYKDASIQREIENSKLCIATVSASILHFIIGIAATTCMTNESKLFYTLFTYTFVAIFIAFIFLFKKVLNLSLTPENVFIKKLSNSIVKLNKGINTKNFNDTISSLDKIEKILTNKIETFENRTFDDTLEKTRKHLEQLTELVGKTISKEEKDLNINTDFDREFSALCNTEESTNSTLFTAQKEIEGKRVAVNTVLFTYSNLWKVAVKYNNTEAMRSISHNIMQLTISHLKKKTTTNWANIISTTIERIVYESTTTNKLSSHGSSAAAAWFYSVVYSIFTEPNTIPIDALSNIKQSFLRSSFIIINTKNRTAIEILCSRLIEGHHDSDHKKAFMYEIANTARSNNKDREETVKDISKILYRAKQIKNENDYRSCLQDLKDHQNILGIKETKDHYENLQKYINWQYRLSTLHLLHFTYGAYLIFTKQYWAIKYIWSYKQPSDSSAVWCGVDVVPTNNSDALNIYFTRIGHSDKSRTLKDHHDSESYFEKYILILLMHLHTDNEAVNISSEEPATLSRIEREASRLRLNIKSILPKNEFTHIFNDKSYLKYISIASRLLNEASINASSKLNTIQVSAEIDQEKLIEFKTNIDESFNNNFYIKDILKSKTTINYKTEKPPKALQINGYNQLHDRSFFFKDWHISHSDIGSIFGSNLAQFFNTNIVNELISKSRHLSIFDFKSEVEKNATDETIILVHPTSLTKLFSKSDNFNYTHGKQEDQPNMVGFLNTGNHNIPVYRINTSNKGAIALFDNDKIYINIWKPYREDSEIKNLYNNYTYIEVKDPTDDDCNLIINNNPKIVEKYNSKEDQINYLRTQSIIKIFKCITIETKDNFSGISTT